MKKKYDAAVKVGTYEQNGATKNRYENVGVVMEGDNGLFMLLKSTFNPAGIRQEGKESVLISFFEPKAKGEPTSHDQAKQDAYQPQDDSGDSSIPF